jgi:purine nucleoside permease
MGKQLEAGAQLVDIKRKIANNFTNCTGRNCITTRDDKLNATSITS